ncbi:MAG: MerR family transcriptional regulator [bacterium]|nr:MerR family transcriptional regulator [bacterium]
MHKYKIGQLSKTMGVSTHLLKHYEKFNLVSPVKDDSTNYRYYDIGQCIKIIASKKYRNMGFPLKDTELLINAMDDDAINQAVENQIKSLEEQIKELEQQKYMAMQYRQDSQDLDRKLGQWYVEELKEFYFIKQTNGRELIEENTLEEMGNNLLDCIPVAKSIVQIMASSFIEDKVEYHWGLAIENEKLSHINNYKFDLNKDYSNIYKIEQQRAFVTYVKVESPYMGNGRLKEEILKKYQMFEVSLTKDAYAEMIKAENVKDTMIHYFRVVIPL